MKMMSCCIRLREHNRIARGVICGVEPEKKHANSELSGVRFVGERFGKSSVKLQVERK